MQDNRTYIKVFHQMLEWGWYKDTNTFRVFMHILLRANYKPSEYLGQKIDAGECVFGYNSWSEELGLSVRQLRTAISHLKSTNEIRVRATNKFSVITVVKWEFWQIEEGIATSQTSRKRQTSDKRATTSKDSKTTTKDKHSMGHPKLDEIRAYVDENNLIIDADYFYKYYETAEWKDNKGKPIKNWKLKALNWNKREEQRNGEQVGRLHNGATHEDNRGLAGTTDRSGSGNGKSRTVFPSMAYSLFQEEGCETSS